MSPTETVPAASSNGTAVSASPSGPFTPAQKEYLAGFMAGVTQSGFRD